jgi:hypothetical protein
MRRRERKRNERDGPVTVLESSDPVLLAVAKSVLEGAKIEYFAKGEAVQNLLGGGIMGTGFNLVTGAIQLQVPAEDANEATELVRPLMEQSRKR